VANIPEQAESASVMRELAVSQTLLRITTQPSPGQIADTALLKTHTEINNASTPAHGHVRTHTPPHTHTHAHTHTHTHTQTFL